MTATANEGYEFVGWFSSTSATTATSTNTTYSYECSGSAKSMYARFEKVETKVTATFNDWNCTKLYEVEIDKDTTPTYGGATPTREGYTFTGWSPALGAIENDTTFTAQYTPITYTITYNNYDGKLLGKGSADYDTKVNLFNNADTLNPTRPSTETTNYTFATWVYENGTPVGADDLIKGDLTLVASYTESERTYTVNFSNPEGGTVSVTANGASVANGGSVAYGTVLTLTAEPDDNHTVGTWTANGETVNGTTYTVTEDVTFVHTFVEKPSNTVTTVVNPADTGTVTGGGKVYDGSSCILNAIPAEGYTFVNWTYTPAGTINEAMVNLSDPAIQFVPQEDVTFTANFAASKGTVNVSAAEGGTVDPDGGDITYPETLTATATANTSEGYIFTHWTVKAQCKDGSEAKEGTDYAIVRENNNVIEIRILTNGTVVDVVANFANAQKIKIYTYTDAGFNKLHLTETEGTDTKDIYNSTQTAILFGDETWFTPTTGELTLTAGYNDAITAQLFSSATEVTDGTVIYVELSDAWTKTEYAYGAPHIAVTASSNSGWSDNITSSDTTGVNQNCYIPQNDTYIGGGVQVSGNIYKFVIPNTSLNNLKNYGFMIYSKQWTSVDFWELNTTHGTYSTSANLYKISENKTKMTTEKLTASLFLLQAICPLRQILSTL